MAEEPERSRLRIALAGQPNVGKSTVFNILTGLDQHVGNWPGKTVEHKVGAHEVDGTLIELVDLPGTYSLSAASEEERAAREYLLTERPDAIIALTDASSLEASLYLVSELVMLDIPLVLGLNMMDVAEQQGVVIEPHVLQAALGIPVIPVTASRNRGVRELIEAALQQIHNPVAPAVSRPTMTAEHRALLQAIEARLAGQVPPPYPTSWVALKVLEGDAEITERVREWAPDEWSAIESLLARHEDAFADIARGRYEWIGRMTRAAEKRPRIGALSITDRIDRVATHPFWGLLVLIGALAAVFWVTYSIAIPMTGWLQNHVIGWSARAVRQALTPGPAWVSGLIADGIVGGAGLVLTFVPVLIVFFTALALLEDVGYMARAAYVMDRYMHPLGLHGKSCLPLMLGFGCNVPAVQGTRILGDPRARLLTILLAPFVPCTGRLAVVAFLAPALVGNMATLASWGFVGLNLIVLAVCGYAVNWLVFHGAHTPFIMAMPAYHRPNARTIALEAGMNTLAFIKKTGSVILMASCLVWALSELPGGNIQRSFLADAGRLLEPAGRAFGFGDWRLIVALFTGFIAKENSVATMGVLFASTAGSGGVAANVARAFAPAGGLAFLAIQMLFVPCLPTLACIRQAAGAWRWVGVSIAIHLTVSLTVGWAVYQIARALL